MPQEDITLYHGSTHQIESDGSIGIHRMSLGLSGETYLLDRMKRIKDEPRSEDVCTIEVIAETFHDHYSHISRLPWEVFNKSNVNKPAR